jgi:hypothetical protein
MIRTIIFISISVRKPSGFGRYCQPDVADFVTTFRNRPEKLRILFGPRKSCYALGSNSGVIMGRIAIGYALPVALLACGIAGTSSARSGEKILYDFPDMDVGQPTGPLLLQGGNLFGTGTASIEDCCGEIFELTRSDGAWQEQTLATFDNTNGSLPYGGVIADANGVLYGSAVRVTGGIRSARW